MAPSALFLFLIPLPFMGQLITNPHLSFIDHPEQAQWGLLPGFLVSVGGGIAVAVESRLRRRAKGKS